MSIYRHSLRLSHMQRLIIKYIYRLIRDVMQLNAVKKPANIKNSKVYLGLVLIFTSFS